MLFYVLITFNMIVPIFAIAHLAAKAIKNSTSSEDFKNGTSAWHKGYAIGASVLLPGRSATEMRRDAWRKYS